MSATISIRSAQFGLEIPYQQIRLIRWFGLPSVDYTIDVSGEGENILFTLKTTSNVRFERRALVVGETEPVIIEELTRVISTSTHNLLDSDFYTELEEADKKALVDILRQVSRRQSRAREAEIQRATMAQMLSNESNPQLDQLTRRADSRKRKIDAVIGELNTFIREYSYTLSKTAMPITDLRKENFWTPDIEEFYSMVFEETDDSPASASRSEVKSAAFDVDNEPFALDADASLVK